jgi:hypothetical protein
VVDLSENRYPLAPRPAGNGRVASLAWGDAQPSAAWGPAPRVTALERSPRLGLKALQPVYPELRPWDFPVPSPGYSRKYGQAGHLRLVSLAIARAQRDVFANSKQLVAVRPWRKAIILLFIKPRSMVDIFLPLRSPVDGATRSIGLGISAMKDTATGSGPRLRPMISIAELLERIPISRTTLDKMVKEGTFPRPYPITPTKFEFFLRRRRHLAATTCSRIFGIRQR